jgi:hypothetical protein
MRQGLPALPCQHVTASQAAWPTSGDGKERRPTGRAHAATRPSGMATCHLGMHAVTGSRPFLSNLFTTGQLVLYVKNL